MKFYNYLFYRLYITSEKHFENWDRFTTAFLCMFLIFDFTLMTVSFIFKGLFGVEMLTNYWQIVIVIIGMGIYYLPRKRFQRIIEKGKQYDSLHSTVAKIPGMLLYFLALAFFLTLIILAGMYMRGNILTSWRL